MWTHGAHRLLAAALVCACGCSFVAVRRPPPAVAPGTAVECTQSRLAPALDTVGAVVTPVAGGLMWFLCAVTSSMQSWGSDPNRIDCGPVLWATILSTAAYTGSAVYGYHVTGDCRRLAQRLPPALPGGASAGGTLRPGPP